MFEYKGYPLWWFNAPAGKLILVLALIWTLVWKGKALWHAAKNEQPVWFVVLLLANTLGILEIAYLVWFQRKNKE